MPLFLTFTLILISSVLLMSFFWHIETSNMMEKWNCIQSQFGWSADDLLMKYQYISDYATALALSSVSAELFYFVHKSTVLQYKWVGVQFGAVIVLCGATHYINLWTFTKHSRTVVIVLTTAKLLTSLVSSATSITLMDVIPYLLNGETKELILKNKTTELDTEMGLIRTQEETSRHAKMLTHEITSTLGRRIILKTTIELHD